MSDSTQDPTKFEKELVIQNKLGLHARPAALFVQIANKFTCKVEVEKDGEVVNGKSIMGIMTLAAGQGAQIVVRTNGSDALLAIKEIENLIVSNFGEE